MDECSDVTVVEQLDIFIRGVNVADNTVFSRFLAIKDMKTTAGADILAAVLEVLNDQSINVNKLASVASDGAGAMQGEHKGAVNRLKQLVPHLLVFWCQAHKLGECKECALLRLPTYATCAPSHLTQPVCIAALASAKAGKDVQYIENFFALLNSVYWFFRHSAKATAEFKDTAHESGERR